MILSSRCGALVAVVSIGLAACGRGSEPAVTPATHAATSDQGIRDGVVTSADGVKIHYREGGRGEIALFFLHGWLGNAHWWDEQLAHFMPRHRVVAMDIAGHGESGRNRKAPSYQAVAADARAVADVLGLKRVVWIGHSMSGEIIIEAANQMPDRTACLVPVDTLNEIGGPASRDETETFFAPLQKDFGAGVRAIIQRGFVPSSPEAVIRRVSDDATSADPPAVIPVLRSGFAYDARTEVGKVKAPIVAINSDKQATKLDVNRKYAPQFDVIVMKSVGHWPMLERPAEFDPLLEQAIDRCLGGLNRIGGT